MTRRLTSSSLAGTSRKLVAVGTSRLASMLATIRAAAPRRGCTVPAPFDSTLAAGEGVAGLAGVVGFEVSGGAGGGGGAGGVGREPGSPPPLRPVAGWATFGPEVDPDSVSLW